MSISKTENKVVVVGAGLGGLALACRLAARGKEVLVFDQAAGPGGKAGQLNLGDFYFDRGPSLFTMPDYVDEVFHAAGKNPRDYYTYSKLDTLCHYFFSDGLKLKASADRKAFAAEVELQTGESAKRVLDFLAESERIHALTEEVFIRRSLHRLKTYFTRAIWRGILGFKHIRAFETMEERIRFYFKYPQVQQLFLRYATYNGSSPYKAPATLNVIPHLEFGIGAYMPLGGIYAIPQALHQLAMDLGVQFRWNEKVSEILFSDGKVDGVKTELNSYAAQAVVSNADVVPTYRKLLPSLKAPEKVLAQERSSSALIFYWGMNREFPELDVHNIFFSGDYKAEFRCLFESEEPFADPTVYVHISAKVCAEHAPEGKENWFVMINAPRHQGQNWPTVAQGIKERITKKLSEALQVDIGACIEEEDLLTPEMIDLRTSSFQGSLYGTSSNNRFAAFLRHANKSKELDGLYFCGGSVHPGGGIPMVMSSAKIVSDWMS
ncbi:MAG: phytoene desaturase [Bacteroidetes bacterium]|nr:MAG: phytoene desaturase [Bacteroidota bacterium]